MPNNLRPWLVVLPLILVCGGTIAGLVYFRSYRYANPANLVLSVPSGPATLVYLDVAALRKSGVLDLISGPIGVEEPEYRAFVERTGFNYRKDLDTAIASFRGDESFYIAQGRFDWQTLRRFVLQSGGSCWDAFCTLRSSSQGRHISFVPLRPDVMAMAVSRNRDAVKTLLAQRKRAAEDGMPNQPIWISMPQPALSRPAAVPSSAQLFAQVVQDAENVVVSVGPDNGRFRAEVDVTCRTAREAIQFVAGFETVTQSLKDTLRASGQVSPAADLRAVLAAGRFQRDDNRVIGIWPIEREFLVSLAGGVR